MTKKQAIKLYKTKFWEDLSTEEIVKFQLFERKLCMPFDIFHGAVEQVLNRLVWTHEFADIKTLQKEFLGEKNPQLLKKS